MLDIAESSKEEIPTVYEESCGAGIDPVVGAHSGEMLVQACDVEAVAVIVEDVEETVLKGQGLDIARQFVPILTGNLPPTDPIMLDDM